MAQQIINVGAVDGDGKMDKLRVAFAKFNQNFTELYARVTIAPNAGVAHAAGVAVVSGVSGGAGAAVGAAAGVGSASGVGATGVPFNPTTLFASGETGGWWDPSDMSSMFQDSAGTIPVNATNQPVGMIRDKSGNNNHLLQAAAGNRPFLQVSGGNLYLAFDGVSESIGHGPSITLVQPETRIMAGRIVAWTNGMYLWDGWSSNSARLFMTPSSPGIQLYAGAAIGDSGDYTVGVNHVSLEVINGASSSIQVDNIAPDTGSAGAINAGGLMVAAAGNAGSAFAGTWGNIQWYGGIFIGRTLTTGETNSCRTFFGAKAGLSL